MRKQKPLDYGLLILSIFLYGMLGFYIQRHETGLLFASYFTVFAIYLHVNLNSSEDNLSFWLYSAILFRAIVLFSIPNLSDDFYRFIWDGRLLASGYHPFAEVPSYYIQHGIVVSGIDNDLFQKLNSPDYFTIYPPVAQFTFWLSVKVFPHSVYGSLLIMKFIIFLAETGSFVLMKKLLIQFKLPSKRILLYALNPLVILELTGNIHLEAIMIFFLMLSIFFLSNQKVFLSAIAFAFAICVKLIPLLFLPALLPKLGWKKSITFYAVVGGTCLILFFPLIDLEIVSGFQNSIGYYFKKFEFNASVYYLVRAWGYTYYGYNIIQTVGWKLALISGSFILIVSLVISNPRAKTTWFGMKLPTINDQPLTMLWVLLIYFLFTTTLHPWYITTLLAISMFTSFQFVILWTALIFLTYAGYSATDFHENLWITSLEYVLVLGYLVYELTWKRKELLS